MNRRLIVNAFTRYSMNAQPTNTQALPPGTRIEEFIIERILGSGGFGITYLATDTALGRQVVIKENLPVQFCFRDPSSLTVAPRHTTGEDAENFKWSLEPLIRPWRWRNSSACRVLTNG